MLETVPQHIFCNDWRRWQDDSEMVCLKMLLSHTIHLSQINVVCRESSSSCFQEQQACFLVETTGSTNLHFHQDKNSLLCGKSVHAWCGCSAGAFWLKVSTYPQPWIAAVFSENGHTCAHQSASYLEWLPPPSWNPRCCDARSGKYLRGVMKSKINDASVVYSVSVGNGATRPTQTMSLAL